MHVHGTALTKSPQTSLEGFWGPDPAKAHDLATRLRSKGFDDLDELFGSVDAVSSKDFAPLARANGVTLSRRATVCEFDNAVAESFFATIKRELITTRPWRSVTELRRAVFSYIEGWYKTRQR